MPRFRLHSALARLNGLLPRSARMRSHLVVAAIFTCLTGIYAWRVVLGFGSELAGHGGDGWNNFWNMWWFRQALGSCQNPYFTPLLHHPHGTPLWLHTLSPFNCLLALPVDWSVGQPAAYNTVFLFSFAASGFTMFLLVYELTGSRLASLLAGCAFTFSPYHFAHAQGHLNLAAMEWFPLFLFFLVRLWRCRRMRDGLGLGIALVLTTFCDAYYALFALFAATGAAGWVLIRWPREALVREVRRPLAFGAAVYLVSGGALLVAMWWAQRVEAYLPTHDARYWSADLQGFFVPGWISAWSDGFVGLWSRWTGNNAENSWYLGYTVLALGVFGLGWPGGRPRPWPWLVLMLSGIVLSLGPRLHWGGRIFDGFPLPYSWLETVFPPLRMSGAPGRWHFLALVGSCVLAGLGTAALMERWKGRRCGRLRLEVFFGLVALAVLSLEMLPRGVETRPVRLPSFTNALRDAPGFGAVLDLGDPSEALFRQTGHGRPLIGGYISRPTQAAVAFERHTPLLRALRAEIPLPAAQVRAAAAAIRLRYIIVPRHHRLVVQAMAAPLGLLQRWSDGALVVYEISW